MKINKVILKGLFFLVESDRGKFACYRNKRALDFGVCELLDEDRNLVGREIQTPENPWEKVVTDATMLCTARREYAWSNEIGTKAEGQFPIPTRKEALEEIASGKDLWGNPWPVPVVEEEEF